MSRQKNTARRRNPGKRRHQFPLSSLLHSFRQDKRKPQGISQHNGRPQKQGNRTGIAVPDQLAANQGKSEKGDQEPEQIPKPLFAGLPVPGFLPDHQSQSCSGSKDTDQNEPAVNKFFMTEDGIVIKRKGILVAFKISASRPCQKIYLNHLPQEEKAVPGKSPSEPEHQRSENRTQKSGPLPEPETEQFPGYKQVYETNHRNHAGMPAFREKRQGKHQTADIHLLPVLPDPEHSQHSQGKKQQIEGIRVTCPGQVGRQGPCVGTEKSQDQNGSLFAVPSGKKPRANTGQQVGQGREKPQAENSVAKNPESQNDGPITDRRLQVPVVHLVIVGVADIIAVLYHLIGIYSVAGFIPGIHILHIQTAETVKGQHQAGRPKEEPVISFKKF